MFFALILWICNVDTEDINILRLKKVLGVLQISIVGTVVSIIPGFQLKYLNKIRIFQLFKKLDKILYHVITHQQSELLDDIALDVLTMWRNDVTKRKYLYWNYFLEIAN